MIAAANSADVAITPVPLVPIPAKISLWLVPLSVQVRLPRPSSTISPTVAAIPASTSSIIVEIEILDRDGAPEPVPTAPAKVTTSAAVSPAPKFISTEPVGSVARLSPNERVSTPDPPS